MGFDNFVKLVDGEIIPILDEDNDKISNRCIVITREKEQITIPFESIAFIKKCEKNR